MHELTGSHINACSRVVLVDGGRPEAPVLTLPLAVTQVDLRPQHGRHLPDLPVRAGAAARAAGRAGSPLRVPLRRQGLPRCVLDSPPGGVAFAWDHQIGLLLLSC